jgi:PAS domain-containing protein
MDKSIIEIIEEDEANFERFVGSTAKTKSHQIISFLFKRLFLVLRKLRIRHSEIHLESGYAKFIFQSTIQAVCILQIISLETTLDSEQYWFWHLLMYIRPDWWAYKLNLLQEFLMISYGYIGAIVALTACAMHNNKPKTRLFKLVKLPLKLLLTSLFDLLIIPFLLILGASMKYADGTATALTEYEGTPASTLSTSVILASISGVFILMLNIIQTFKLVAFSDIGYSQRLSTSSKSSNKLDFQVQAYYSLVVGLYLLTAILHPAIFRLSTSAMGFYIAHQVYATLPYYNVKVNTMKFISFIVLGWAGIALVVGSLVDSTATSFILVVFVSPLLGGIASGACPDRLDKLRAYAGSKLETTENQVEFELCLRFGLESAEGPEDFEFIQDCFNKFRENCPKHSKIFDIYEVVFCIDSLNDPKLANVKLANLMRPGLSLEASYYEDKLRCLLNKKDMKSEDFSYLEYRLELDEVKKMDQQATIASYQMWHEFTLECPSFSKLMSYFKQIEQISSVVKKRYEQLMRLYPEAKHVCEIYSSFLSVVMNNLEESRIVLNKLAKLSSKKQSNPASLTLKEFSYFDENNGILIVETRPDNFSKIAYSNERAAEIFGLTLGDFIGSDLNLFIPPPYHLIHRKAMWHFVWSCKRTQLELPFNLFVYTSSHFLKECHLVVKITAVNSYPIFLVAVIERPITREVAIVDDRGKIYSHSQGLPMHIGAAEERLEGRYIFEFLPIEISRLKEFKAFSVMSKGVKLRMAYGVTVVNKIIIRLLYFFISYDEYKSWKLNTNHSAIEDLKKYASVIPPRGDTSMASEHNTPKPLRTVRILSRKESSVGVSAAKQLEAEQRSELVIAEPKIVASHSVSQLDMSISDKTQKKLFNKFMQSLQLLRWSTYACTVLIVAWNLSIMIYVVVKLDYIRHNSYLQILGSVTHEVLYLGFNTRLLNLAQNGVELVSVEEIHLGIEQAFSNLTDNLKFLESREAELKQLGMGDLFDNDFAREWRLIDSKPVLSHKNIIDLVSDFTASASVVSSLPVEQAYLTHPDVFFLYRNGLAESFLKLNSTVEAYEQLERRYIDDVESSMLNIFAISYATIALGFVLIAASVYWLQMSLDRLWMHLTSFSSSQAFEMKMNFHDRLITFFGDEAIEGVQHSELQDNRRTLDKTKNVVYLRFGIWKGICLKLSMLLVISGVLFVLFYYVSFLSLKRDSVNYPKRMQVAQQVRISTLAMAAWAQGITLDEVPEIEIEFSINSYYGSPKIHLEEEIDRLDDQFEILRNIPRIQFSKESMISESIDTDVAFFKLGLHTAGWSLRCDMAGYGDWVSIAELSNLTKNSLMFSTFEDEVLSSLEVAINKKFTDQNIAMEAFTAANSLATLLLGYYVYKRMYDFLQKKAMRITKQLTFDT